MLGNIGDLFVKCMQQVTKGHLYHLLGISDYYVMYRQTAKPPLSYKASASTPGIPLCSNRFSDEVYFVFVSCSCYNLCDMHYHSLCYVDIVA